MFDAFDASEPDPRKRELASVRLVDELFGPGLLDRLAKQEGREAWLREVRARKRGGPEGTAPKVTAELRRYMHPSSGGDFNSTRIPSKDSSRRFSGRCVTASAHSASPWDDSKSSVVPSGMCILI